MNMFIDPLVPQVIAAILLVVAITWIESNLEKAKRWGREYGPGLLAIFFIYGIPFCGIAYPLIKYGW